MNRRAWLLAALAAAGYLGWRGRPGEERAHTRGGYLADALGPAADAGDFARAERSRPMRFPRDHGPHPRFRTEWWYFTGHLQRADGGRAGFQLTLFRFELVRAMASSPSRWRTPRVMLGHFAVSDLAAGRFLASERLGRALPELAGVSRDPPAAWLDDWRIEYQPEGARWQLAARSADAALTLDLVALGPPVAQGEAGLSRKSAAAGNASYYYSIPRLAARGRLVLGAREHAVSGEAWLDREWSTSALDREQTGWDWFALQFADGANLMVYRLRERDGGTSPYSAGTHVDAVGRVTRLAAADIALATTHWWASPHGGTRYPAGWRLAVPSLGLDVDVQPLLADQEWRGRFPYWEGAAQVRDRRGASRGRAYVELTGY